MLKTILSAFMLVSFAGCAFAQDPPRSQLFIPMPDPWAETYGEKGRAPDQSVSGLLSFPLPDFNQSHVSGIGVGYARTGFHWDSLGRQTRRWSYLLRGGADYFFGKNEQTAGEDFTYGGWLYLHAMGGLAYNPSGKFRLGFTAGPGLGIYEGVTQFGVIGELSVAYYYQPEWSFGPALIYRQQFEDVDMLLSAGIRINYHF